MDDLGWLPFARGLAVALHPLGTPDGALLHRGREGRRAASREGEAVMLAPDFCGAYDGWHRPGGPEIDTVALYENERPACFLLIPADPGDPPPQKFDGTIEVLLILSAVKPLPLPEDVLGHVIAAMDKRLPINVMGGTRAQVAEACAYLAEMSGGGRA